MEHTDAPGINNQVFKMNLDKDWFWYKRPDRIDPEKSKLIYIHSQTKIVIDDKGQIFKWYFSPEHRRVFYYYMGACMFEEENVITFPSMSRFNQWELKLILADKI